MARGVNKVILIGNLGRDPELKHFPGSGDAYCNVSIATSESWKDKNTGEQREKTEWHNLSFKKRLAEIVAEYCRKGGTIYVEGKLSTRKYQASDGSDRYTTEIQVRELQMLGGKNESAGAPPARDTAPQARTDSGSHEEDDIPF